MEKRMVKIGLSSLYPMTVRQAMRYGNAHMPTDMKRAGFKTVIFTSDPEINGGVFFRINYAYEVNK